jgi:hypothetical protein
MTEDAKPPSFWQTIPGCLTGVAAILTALTGLIVAIHQISKLNDDTNKPPHGVVTPMPETTSSPIVPVKRDSGKSIPKPPQTFVKPPEIPQNNCPFIEGMFWLQYPNKWYGSSESGDRLTFRNPGGFDVWDGSYNQPISYPDPYAEIQRDVWIPLQGSRFSVCVDSAHNSVFGFYQ